MSERVEIDGLKISRQLFDFINEAAMPGTGVEQAKFWSDFSAIVHDLAPKNRALLAKRDDLQAKIDAWYRENGAPSDMETYKAFLKDIGYLVPEGPAFQVTTQNVDPEIAVAYWSSVKRPSTSARQAANPGSDVIASTTRSRRGFNSRRLLLPARSELLPAALA